MFIIDRIPKMILKLKEGNVMKKARVLSILLILAMALSLTLSAAAYADGEKNEWKGIVWEQDSLLGALFVRGIGVMPVDQPMPWQDDASSNTAVCFDSGITEIPAGFTAGCVNMKTIMIPASMRAIGQGVLAVSGGLKDVFYEGTLQGLLSIRMYPEDRAALNGAVFHGSKIVVDEASGRFEYVPEEHSEQGRMEIKEDPKTNTVTGTLENGTTYTVTTTYDSQGNPTSEVTKYDNDEYHMTVERTYYSDGSYSEKTTLISKETGKEETGIGYYDRNGNLKKFVYTSPEGESTEVYENGELIRTTLSYEGGESVSYYKNGKRTRREIIAAVDGREITEIYAADGETVIEQTTVLTNGSTRTIKYNEQGKKTSESTFIPDNQTNEILYNEDGTYKQVTVTFLGGVREGDTDVYTYNPDQSYTRVTTHPDSTTETHYYDKDGNETTEAGSPIVP